MSRRWWAVLCLSAAWLAGAQRPPVQQDTLLRAMSDELDRARKLRLVSLEMPYFVEYTVHDADIFHLSAALGAVSDVQENRMRLPRIRVRVGDYQFDNGNYVYSDYTFGTPYALGAFPIDDNYEAFRQYFWLATDVAYKSSLEAIARKRAALKNITVTDQPPDFSKAEPVSMLLSTAKRAIDDEDAWKSRLRGLSALFAPHPQIVSSGVEFQVVQGAFYLVNSEGTRVRVPEGSVHLHVTARALAPDGMTLRDAVGFHALDIAGMPPEAQLREGVQAIINDLEALLRAPVGEAYTGPVLFEPEAAAQLLGEVLGRNLALRRRPVAEPGRPLPFVESELEGRLGSRILPEWIDVVDDPTLAEWRGHPLYGHYLIDLEGVAPQPLTLVEKGLLKNYLLTRQPLRGVPGSNGRARLAGGYGANVASFGSLFVRASETSTLPELKKKLIDLCRQRNKPYGLLVRKMDFPSSANHAEFQRLVAAMAQDSGAMARLVSVPVLLYRVYTDDGHEDLVRGLRFRDVSTRSLRDIVAAGGEAAVFDYQENGAPFALLGAGSFVAESSVIAPAVLFDELQLVGSERELPRLPIVAPPPLTGLTAPARLPLGDLAPDRERRQAVSYFPAR